MIPLADGKVIIDTLLDSTGFETGINSLKSVAAKGFAAITASVAAAAAGIIAIGKSALDTGKEFDTAMSQVAATMGTTVDQISGLSAAAEEMGATTKFTATEAAEGINILAMAGLAESEILAENAQGATILATTLSLASAGAIDMAASATYLTGAVKGFSDEASNAQYYADLMAKGATMANTDVAGLGEALSDAAATASAYGQQADSVTLSLLRLAEQNITGSAASTALAAAMKNLYTPTDQAKKALDKLSVSAYNADGSSRDFNDVVDDLSAALAEYSDEEANAYKQTIFGIQGLDAYNKMTVTSTEKVEQFKEGLAGASEEFDGLGAAAGQAATQLDNLEGDLTLLESAWSGFLLNIYAEMQESSRGIVQLGTDCVTQLSNAFTEGGLDGLVSAVGGVFAQVIQQILSHVPTIISTASSLIASFCDGLLENQDAFAAAAVQMITALAAGVVSAGASLGSTALQLVTTLVSGLIECLPSLMDTGIQFVLSIITGIAESLPTLMGQAATIVATIAAKIGENIPALLDAGVQLVQSIATGIAENLPTLVQTGIDLIGQLTQGIQSTLPELIPMALNALMSFTGTLRENVGQLVDAGINLILQLGQGIADSIPTLVETIPTIVSNIAGIINDNAPKLLSCGIQLLATLAKGIIDAIPTIVANIPQIIQAIVDVFTAFNWVNFGSQLITNIGNGIKGMASFASSSMSNIRNAIVNAIQNLPSTLMNLGRNIIQFLSSGISRMLGTVAGAIGTIAGTIVNAIMALPSQVLGLGKNIIQGLIDGIASLGTGVVDAVIEIGNNILNGFQSLFGIHSPSTVMDEMGGYLIEGLLNGLSGAWDSISSFFSDAWSSIQDTVSGAWDSIQETASTAWNAVTGTVSTAASGIYNTAKDKFTSASSTIAKQVTGAKTAISSGFDKAKSSVTTAASNIYKTVSSKFSSARSTVSTAAGNIYTSINSKFNSAKSAVATAAGNIYTSISSKFTSAKTPVANAVGSIYTTASGKFANVKTSIAKAVSSIYSTVASKFSSMKSSMSSTFSQLKSSATAWGKDICSNLSSGIRSAMSRVTSAASSVASKIRSYLHFSEPDVGPLSDFHTYMPDMLELMAKGIRDNADVAISEVSTLADYMSKGLLDGAEQNAGATVNAALNVMDGLADNVKNGMSDLDQIDRNKIALKVATSVEWPDLGAIADQLSIGVQAELSSITARVTAQMADRYSLETVIGSRLGDYKNLAESMTGTMDNLKTVPTKLDDLISEVRARRHIYLDSKKIVGGTIDEIDKEIQRRSSAAKRGR